MTVSKTVCLGSNPSTPATKDYMISGKPIAVPFFGEDLITCMVCNERKAPRVMDPIGDDCLAKGSMRPREDEDW